MNPEKMPDENEDFMEGFKTISLSELVKRLKPIEDMTPKEMAEFVKADLEAQEKLEEMVEQAKKASPEMGAIIEKAKEEIKKKKEGGK